MTGITLSSADSFLRQSNETFYFVNYILLVQTNLKKMLLMCSYILKFEYKFIFYSSLKLIIQMEFIYAGYTNTDMKKPKVEGKTKR